MEEARSPLATSSFEIKGREGWCSSVAIPNTTSWFCFIFGTVAGGRSWCGGGGGREGREGYAGVEEEEGGVVAYLSAGCFARTLPP